jgi:hypothetical protein
MMQLTSANRAAHGEPSRNELAAVVSHEVAAYNSAVDFQAALDSGVPFDSLPPLNERVPGGYRLTIEWEMNFGPRTRYETYYTTTTVDVLPGKDNLIDLVLDDAATILQEYEVARTPNFRNVQVVRIERG